MKISHLLLTSKKRILYPTRLTHNQSRGLTSKVLRHKKTERQKKTREEINEGLAICLFGYSAAQQNLKQVQGKKQQQTKIEAQSSVNNPEEREGMNMYDLGYEEELRQFTVMAEVLPDAEMWAKWEKTEAPLRQGRGWYPRLDRHFLELLVISEIHCLSHPLNSSSPPGQAEGIHRHASRVRRVACERIGVERLHAYCERVKEAFEAYMMGGWARARAQAAIMTKDNYDEGEIDEDHLEEEGEGEEDEDEEGRERGRTLERGDGSVQRDLSPNNRPSVVGTDALPPDDDDQSRLLEIDLKDVQLDEVSEGDHEDCEPDESSTKATVGTRWSTENMSTMDLDGDRAYPTLVHIDHPPLMEIPSPDLPQMTTLTNVRLTMEA